MIKAAVTVSASMEHTMTQDMLRDYVLSSLHKHIAGEVAKKMTIIKTYDSTTDSTTYTGTFTAPITHTSGNSMTIGASTVSGFNGTVSVSNKNKASVQEILRVVEYTKNGKVTRVELQKYDEENDDWIKIPRIQIEE